ncbi:hypothetical protein HPB47_006238 [Ixodes persulcatus]|uniref:Uncharacterized protein n=1 Tax=Ixodes persulcatus TaxID=34615 RepID=A0AC60PBE4_IXOPE|nr:hypothetical protein HPB47_006238 [Ixodes persulcatus]
MGVVDGVQATPRFCGRPRQGCSLPGRTPPQAHCLEKSPARTNKTSRTPTPRDHRLTGARVAGRRTEVHTVGAQPGKARAVLQRMAVTRLDRTVASSTDAFKRGLSTGLKQPSGKG